MAQPRYSFRWLRSCSKPKKKQAWIYYTCVNYDEQPQQIRRKIDSLCEQVAGEHADALKDALIHADTKTIEGVAMEHFVSANTIWSARLRFFNEW